MSDSDGGDGDESKIVNSDDTLMNLGETRDDESDSDGGDDDESDRFGRDNNESDSE